MTDDGSLALTRSSMDDDVDDVGESSPIMVSSSVDVACGKNNRHRRAVTSERYDPVLARELEALEQAHLHHHYLAGTNKTGELTNQSNTYGIDKPSSPRSAQQAFQDARRHRRAATLGRFDPLSTSKTTAIDNATTDSHPFSSSNSNNTISALPVPQLPTDVPLLSSVVSTPHSTLTLINAASIGRSATPASSMHVDGGGSGGSRASFPNPLTQTTTAATARTDIPYHMRRSSREQIDADHGGAAVAAGPMSNNQETSNATDSSTSAPTVDLSVELGLLAAALAAMNNNKDHNPTHPLADRNRYSLTVPAQQQQQQAPLTPTRRALPWQGKLGFHRKSRSLAIASLSTTSTTPANTVMDQDHSWNSVDALNQDDAYPISTHSPPPPIGRRRPASATSTPKKADNVHSPIPFMGKNLFSFRGGGGGANSWTNSPIRSPLVPALTTTPSVAKNRTATPLLPNLEGSDDLIKDLLTLHIEDNAGVNNNIEMQEQLQQQDSSRSAKGTTTHVRRVLRGSSKGTAAEHSNHGGISSPHNRAVADANAARVVVTSSAKVRATSFLTSTIDSAPPMYITSSEQDASTWQLDLPTRRQVEFCAQMCRFVEHYHTSNTTVLPHLFAAHTTTGGFQSLLKMNKAPLNAATRLAPAAASLLDLSRLVGCTRGELEQVASQQVTRATTSLVTANDQSAMTDIEQQLPAAACAFLRSLLLETSVAGADLAQICGYFQSAMISEQSTITAKDTASTANSIDQRRQVLIVERQQRQLVCIVRGTSLEQRMMMTATTATNAATNADLQHKRGAGAFVTSDTAPEVILLPNSSSTQPISVLQDRYAAWSDLQSITFDLLDRLVEQNPFYDVVFTGHSYGGSLALLAAYFYAASRPDLRVSVTISSAPRVSWDPHDRFRTAVHSLANLQVFRVELGSSSRSGDLPVPLHGNITIAGRPVGHTLRVQPANNSKASKNNENELPSVRAYRFSDNTETVDHADRHPTLITDLVTALMALPPGEWVTDYINQSGPGVQGSQDHEARHVS